MRAHIDRLLVMLDRSHVSGSRLPKEPEAHDKKRPAAASLEKEGKRSRHHEAPMSSGAYHIELAQLLIGGKSPI